MLCTSSRTTIHDRICRHPPDDRKSFRDVISEADELRSEQVVSLPLIIILSRTEDRSSYDDSQHND